MRNFVRSRARVMATAAAAWLSVCAPASAQPAKTPTVKERYEAAQEKDEKVRLQLTSFTEKAPPPDLSAQVSQVAGQYHVE